MASSKTPGNNYLENRGSWNKTKRLHTC